MIDDEIWEETQNKLREKQPEFQKSAQGEKLNPLEYTQHPLKGFLHTDDGFALTPTFTSKKVKLPDNITIQKRYRYYVSQKALGQGYESSKIKTISAILLEQTIQSMIAQTLPSLRNILINQGLAGEQVALRLKGCSQYLSSLDVHENGFKKMIRQLAPSVIFSSTQVCIHINLGNIKNFISSPPKLTKPHIVKTEELPNVSFKIAQEKIIIKAEVNLKRSRGRTELVDLKTGKVVTPIQSNPNRKLIQVIAQAEFWRQQMMKKPTQSLIKIVKSANLNYVRRVLNAAYLAPDIKKAILQGTQPPELQVQDLIKKHPMEWKTQKRELGFD